ncbi:MAG: heme lyase CcmF/NrfE family subunit [Leptospiraceae bacterium]|nr:heme lyase CcmF/NrfE family subunit [Leptospiraceae bacterium]MCP5498463.1 heme lyase CcmF/NrfE family subunit [Leptospiraceae bacterium]
MNLNDLGALSLICSFSLLSFNLFQILFGLYKKHEKALEFSRYLLMANSALVFLSFLILCTQLARMDLNNHYVVMHSSQHLPLFYRVTSIWSGSSGSLLFWNLLLNLFGFILLWNTRNMRGNRISHMVLTLNIIALFFTYLAVFYSDAQPFLEFQPAALVGRGLNPLLQHWAMVIHPPILYIGYVSFAVPFAIAMSALLTGELTADWLKIIRRWTIFSWLALGTGILLGSKWAYEELGWGGYWAWDPVENASLMPWLLSSAFLHSIIIQERRGMLKFWNMLLIILTFHFTLLGTWITRSGVLEGPHSFSKSSIGTPFIIYIILSFLVYTAILIYKRNELQPERDLEAITSKEGSFFLNNFLLVLSCLVILLGVFSPLLYGKEFKAPWFNSWGVPAGLMLMLLMGASPLLAWRKGASTIFFKSLFRPFLFGGLVALLYSFLYARFFTRSDYNISDYLGEIYSTLTVGLGAFTLAGIFQEYHRGIRARQAQFRDNYFKTGFTLLLNNKRRYGGYLVHFALVLIFIGYAGNAFKQNTSIRFFYNLVNPSSDEVVYVSQDKGIVGNYEVEANTLKLKPLINGDPSEGPSIYNVIVSQEAAFKVKRHLTDSVRMVTERRFYPQINHLNAGFETHIPTSEPSIHSTAKEDFYIQIGAIESAIGNGENPNLPMMYMDFYFGARSFEEKMQKYKNFPNQVVANLEVWVNPLVKLIWIGSVLFFLSGLLILLPLGEKRFPVRD